MSDTPPEPRDPAGDAPENAAPVVEAASAAPALTVNEPPAATVIEPAVSELAASVPIVEVAPAPTLSDPGLPEATTLPTGLAPKLTAASRLAKLEALARRLTAPLPLAGVWTLRVLVALLGTAALGTYLYIAVAHLRYPFEIEWMEGGLLDEIKRAAAGQKLYVKPTVEYVPYLYAPLYFYAAAAFGKVLGVSFFSARLVSVLASLGVIAFIGRFVQRETQSKLAGYAAACLFAGTYKLATAFYDIARVDSLFVLLLLAGLYALRFGSSNRSRIFAAALFTLAFLTKQSASMVFAPVALYAIMAERKRGLVFAGAGAGMMAGVTLLLNWVHDGWFWYFVFWLPRQHPWVKRMWTDFWLEDMLAPLAICFVLGLFYVLVDTRSEAVATTEASPPVPRRALHPRAFYFFTAGGMLVCSWLGRLHAGGWPNVIMPGFAVLAMLFGLGIGSGFSAAARMPPRRRRGVEAFFLVVAAVQFLVIFYDPRRYIPSFADKDSGQKLIEQIKALDGDVFMPAHGHLATMAGKKPFAQEMAIGDIIGIQSPPSGGPVGVELRNELKRAFAEKRFGAVIIDTDFFKKEIEDSYKRKGGDPFPSREVFWPVTGFHVRPKAIYVAKPK